MSKESILPILLLILLTSLVVLGFFKSKIKGIFGEKKVGAILSFLDKSQYKILNNVVLEREGRTSQIDHLVISDFGVFVIETKNYKGWILGSENSEYWTQVLFKRKEKLYNPIRQNNGHILSLKKCLAEFKNVNYISIIVFSSSAEIKVKTETDITYPLRLLKVIRKYSAVTLSENEKQNIFDKVQADNVSGSYDKRQHIQSIKQRINSRDELIKQNKCPYCTSELVLRKGKFGQFLACSNFPRCKFTKNV
jgi:Nuclease-related domain/Topoisomerase DNA binding C4 zinc finger